MKSSEGKIGRIFILQLEDGDELPSCIEKFAMKNKISIAQVFFIGGVGSGEIVVVPRQSDQLPPDPMVLPLDGAHETLGTGIIAPDSNNKPVLHIHAAMGRSGQTITGCLRKGVKTWVTGEVVIYELLSVKAKRLPDKKTGFTLLKV